MSKIYLEIFDREKKKVFQQLSHFQKDGYLAGGTALALQIGHRKSFDFDIFVDKAITNMFKLKVSQVFGRVDFYLDGIDQISFTTREKVNIAFVWYYFKRLFSTVRSGAIDLAAVNDITADKAYTIGRRAVWRDYVDIFFLLKKKITTLEQIILLSQKKFAGQFNEVLFLEQLTYFEDLRTEPIQFLRKDYSPAAITKFLEEQVRQYTRKKLAK